MIYNFLNFCIFFRFIVLRIFTPRKSLGSCTNENGSDENEKVEKSCANWVVSLRSQFTVIHSSDGRRNLLLLYMCIYTDNLDPLIPIQSNGNICIVVRSYCNWPGL